MATSKLADILRQEYKTKGLFSGATSAVSKSVREKLDIRNALFGGSGLGSVIGRKIFGKGYSAMGGQDSKVSSASETLTSGAGTVLKEISINSQITAKNTLALPSMARDMHLVKQNIAKLVKLQGGTPTTKAGDWFSRQAAREAAYESKFNKKESPTKIVEKKESSGIFGLIGGALSLMGGLVSGLASGVNSLTGIIGTVVGGLGLFGKSIFKVLRLLAKTRIGKLLGLGLGIAGLNSFGGDANAADLDPNTNTEETPSNTKSDGVSLGTTAALAVGAVGTAKFATKVPSLAKATGEAILDAKTTTTGSVVGSSKNTKWARFLKFVARRSPKLWARIGVKLAQCGALMAIPFAGWIGALINFGFTLWLAWDIYTLWKEFTGTDKEDDSNVAEDTAGTTPVNIPTPVNNRQSTAPGATPQNNNSPTPSGDSTSDAKMPKGKTISNTEAIGYLVKKGLTPEQAAGVVGNLLQESQLNSGAYNKSEGAYGLAQWRGSRLTDLQNFAASRGKTIDDVNTQLDFILHELKGKEKQAGDMLFASKTAEEAAYNFGKYYERPKTVEQSRMSWASQTLAQYKPNGAGSNNVQLASTEGGAAVGAKLNVASRNAANQAPAPSSQAPVVVDNKTINNTQVASGGGSGGMTAYDMYFGKYLINRTT